MQLVSSMDAVGGIFGNPGNLVDSFGCPIKASGFLLMVTSGKAHPPGMGHRDSLGYGGWYKWCISTDRGFVGKHHVVQTLTASKNPKPASSYFPPSGPNDSDSGTQHLRTST
jgi:hypothetical protein